MKMMHAASLGTAVSVLCVGLALAAEPPATAPGAGNNAQTQLAPAPSAIDAKTFQAQVILDRLGFSPGVVDGKQGFTLKLALSGYQEANKLPITGALDAATTAALSKVAGPAPVVDITITPQDVTGPYVGPLPKREDDQAKLPALGYANILEMLAERYHTTSATLVALNSPQTKLVAGAKIKVPNVATAAHDYPAKLPDEYKQTLAGLNVPSGAPMADHLVVSKSQRSLSVFDDDGKLIAQFPITTGSKHDPLPLGTWKIVGASYNPEFDFNPKLFWDAKKGEKKAMLKPGPNGPVGIVWLDLSKPHYGIHGTPEPQNIGRTESHGCIRLTNWDAGRLSLMVKPGTPALFKS